MSNIKLKKIKSIQNIYSCENQIVCFSNKFLRIEQEIKYFLRSRMYDNKNVIVKNNKGKRIVKKLFYIIKKNPRKYLTIKKNLKFSKHRQIADFISGMTDRYAMNLYNNLK